MSCFHRGDSSTGSEVTPDGALRLATVSRLGVSRMVAGAVLLAVFAAD